MKPIVVDGILYGSRAAAAEAFGIPQSKFNHRLKVGKSPEQAAEIAKREKYERVRINTKYGSWPSLKSACFELGLKYGTIHRRFSACGWSIEQALGFESPPIQNK